MTTLTVIMEPLSSYYGSRCRNPQLSTGPSFQSPVEERKGQLYEGDNTYSQVHNIIRESSGYVAQSNLNTTILGDFNILLKQTSHLNKASRETLS